MDRRVVLAIVLMMAVAILPSLFLKPVKRPAGRPGGRADSMAVGAGAKSPATAPIPSLPPAAGPPVRRSDSLPEDTIVVSSPLYRYAFSTRGGRMIEATLLRYPSMRPDEKGRPAQLLPLGSQLLGLGLLVGRDTVWLRDWSFAPSTRQLAVSRPEPLTLTARNGALAVTVTYTFRPDDYLVEVAGKLEGLGPEGATLLVGMGPGLRNTESDSVEHRRELGVVVKGDKASLTRFGKLKPHQPLAFNGPFEWVAVKSKYFVTALLALDSTGTGRNGGIGGASALAIDTLNRSPAEARIAVGLPVAGGGSFHYELYAGPLEYPRL